MTIFSQSPLINTCFTARRQIFDINFHKVTMYQSISSFPSQNGACGNCDENAAKVAKLHNQVKERDLAIRELKALCNKFETQLTTQDKLLEQWALAEGHKIPAPK